MVLPSRRQTPRNRTFFRRVETLKRSGFTDAEATWGANANLHMANPTVRRVRRARESFIRLYMANFSNVTRQRAIEIASAAAQGRARRDGLTGEDINNIFKQISP